jgi:hypothetical protein
LNGISSLPNIMKIYQAVQKLLVVDTQTHTDTHTHTHTHTDTHRDREKGDLISPFSFLESWLINIGTRHFVSHI